MRSVKAASAWPSQVWICLMSLPFAKSSEAQVWRKVWKLTHGMPTSALAGLSTRSATLPRISSVPTSEVKTGSVGPE